MADERQVTGGSFAPPVDKATLKKWDDLREETVGFTRVAIDQLFDLVTSHQSHPRNVGKGKPHASMRAMVVPLSTKAKESCEHLIPSADERRIMSELFESLNGDVRTMAFHLLWYATELALDREPITSDMVSGLIE